MEYLDSQFEAWLAEQEVEADRVKRAADYRQRQASELLVHINHARILLNRAKDGGAEIDPSHMVPVVEKIKELRNKIGK